MKLWIIKQEIIKWYNNLTSKLWWKDLWENLIKRDEMVENDGPVIPGDENTTIKESSEIKENQNIANQDTDLSKANAAVGAIVDNSEAFKQDKISATGTDLGINKTSETRQANPIMSTGGSQGTALDVALSNVVQHKKNMIDTIESAIPGFVGKIELGFIKEEASVMDKIRIELNNIELIKNIFKTAIQLFEHLI